MIRKALLLLSGLVMWFGAAAQSDDFKITGGPYLQMLGEHEVTIIWATNRDAVSPPTTTNISMPPKDPNFSRPIWDVRSSEPCTGYM